MPESTSFLKRKGNYENLLVYKECCCIDALTYYFANKYFNRTSRTIDQMVQASRSGKQNIVEGCESALTSRETGIKLLNVARASLKELLEDYRDYIVHNGLNLWQPGDEKYAQAVRACRVHNDPRFFLEAALIRSDETVANIVITLLYQADSLLNGLLREAEREFLENGGIREEMSRARRNIRGYL